MPSPEERLPDLLRQRALVQEQLAWIDREIAAISGAPSVPAPSRSDAVAPGAAPATRTAAVTPATPRIAPAARPAGTAGEADAIIESYRAETLSAPEAARRGCFIVFGAGLLLFGLSMFALYLYTRGHPPIPGR